MWVENPRHAWPKWFNLIPGVNKSETIVLRSGVSGTKTVSEDGEVIISLPFEYPYDGFPKELNVFFTASSAKLAPFVTISWFTPDGREILLRQGGVRTERYMVAADARLRSVLGASPEVGLFSKPSTSVTAPRQALQGKYELRIVGHLFEPDSDLDVKMVAYGQVHGWAGTDHMRRDLTVGLLWGTPIALIFGLVAAMGISASQFTFGAISAYYGGKTDATIQFITRVMMVLPSLPIYMMVALFWSRSIWVILGAVVVLNLIGGGVVTYRAMFLQAKESPYIDAARAYGAKSRRVVFRYLLPRVLPVLIPGFVTAIPAFVFLEAGLAFLGLGDPSLPTWGKLLNDSGIAALLQGHYYWVIQPAILLMVTGFAFALVGFALDRIFNPRLRTL
jgi:peptide/nickel transport system permease protein